MDNEEWEKCESLLEDVLVRTLDIILCSLWSPDAWVLTSGVVECGITSREVVFWDLVSIWWRKLNYLVKLLMDWRLLEELVMFMGFERIQMNWTVGKLSLNGLLLGSKSSEAFGSLYSGFPRILGFWRFWDQQICLRHLRLFKIYGSLGFENSKDSGILATQISWNLFESLLSELTLFIIVGRYGVIRNFRVFGFRRFWISPTSSKRKISKWFRISRIWRFWIFRISLTTSKITIVFSRPPLAN